MLTFKFLSKKKSSSFSSCKEYKYVEENKKVLDKVKSFYRLSEENYGFYLLCMIILIEVFKTKDMIEKTVDNLSKASIEEVKKEINSLLSTRPCIANEEEKIFLPQFPKSLNYIYTHNPESLNVYPYDSLKNRPTISCIDLFDEYNYQLFDSFVPNLKFILKNKTSACYYYDNFETIYVINDQGKLDIAIPLFDKYMKEKNKENLEQRIKKVMEFFYDNNRNQFIHSLYNENFISRKMFQNLIKKMSIRNVKKQKRMG